MLLTTGLVAGYVLPTFDVNTHALSGATGYLAEGHGGYGTALMLLIASFGLTFWFGTREPLRRIAAAAVILLLTVGGFSVLGTRIHWPYEAWLALGCATGLLVLAVTSSWQRCARACERDRPRRSGAPARVAFLQLGEGVFRATGIVLRLERLGRGLTGGLVAIFVVLLLGFRHLAPELAVAVAIYVLGDGLSSTVHGSLGYGAFIGFAGASLLLLAVILQPRKPARFGARLVPVAACLVFLAIPVAALTGRLPTHLELYGPWRLVPLQAAAVVIGLRLIGRWLTGPPADDELLLLPLVLLVLVGLDLGEMEHVLGINWEGWVPLALALLLVALGWLGRRGGLDNFRIPEEIWRVDRISAGEN